jgi:hypothetical protein
MKPKLTIAVRRGLKSMNMIVDAAIDADQSEECPYWKGKDLKDLKAAGRWIAHLETEQAAEDKAK